MDKALRRWMLRQILIRVIIMLLAAVLLTTVCLALKQQSVAEELKKLDAVYMNKYNLDLNELDFLEPDEKEQYKKKFIQACEAYNLQKVTKIVIDEGSIQFDKETNMYEWTIYCNDPKQTAFLSVYKKTTGEFTIEREYGEKEKSVEEIEKKNQEREKPKQEKTAIITIPEGTRCNIKQLTYPRNSELFQTQKQKNQFRKELEFWLGYENIASAEAVQFDQYNQYEGKVQKKELLFLVRGSKPNIIRQLSAVYDSEWAFAILL